MAPPEIIYAQFENMHKLSLSSKDPSEIVISLEHVVSAVLPQTATDRGIWVIQEGQDVHGRALYPASEKIGTKQCAGLRIYPKYHLSVRI